MKNKIKKSTHDLGYKPYFLLIMLVFLGFSSTTSSGQNDLSGTCWQNTFGSFLRINTHDLKTGVFRGTYGSTTGSVGIYSVIGQSVKCTRPLISVISSLSFVVSWNNIAAAATDPSENWTSTMSGTFNVFNSFGEARKMELVNVISAPTEFEAVKIFQPGNLPQSQTFIEVTSGECSKINMEAPKLITGSGTATDDKFIFELLGQWKTNTLSGILPLPSIIIEEVLPRGESYEKLKYYEIKGTCSYMDRILPFVGMVSPYIIDDNGHFSFALSITTTDIQEGKSIKSFSGVSTGSMPAKINIFYTNTEGFKLFDGFLSGVSYYKN